MEKECLCSISNLNVFFTEELKFIVCPCCKRAILRDKFGLTDPNHIKNKSMALGMIADKLDIRKISEADFLRVKEEIKVADFPES